MMPRFVSSKRLMGCLYEILANSLSDPHLNKCVTRYTNVYIEIKNAIAETREDNQCLIYKFSYYDMIQMFVLSTVVVQDVERY